MSSQGYRSQAGLQDIGSQGFFHCTKLQTAHFHKALFKQEITLEFPLQIILEIPLEITLEMALDITLDTNIGNHMGNHTGNYNRNHSARMAGQHVAPLSLCHRLLIAAIGKNILKQDRQSLQEITRGPPDGTSIRTQIGEYSNSTRPSALAAVGQQNVCSLAALPWGLSQHCGRGSSWPMMQLVNQHLLSHLSPGCKSSGAPYLHSHTPPSPNPGCGTGVV